MATVAVTMRDGVRLYIDVFRPANQSGPLPVILTYSPYGKHARKGLDMFDNEKKDVDPGRDVGPLSHYTVWEGPDPLYWCQQGFVVINADTRGSWGSEGTLTFYSPTEARDGYDLVEWCGAQSWSNGRVGMSGVSYLASSQWNVAATRPPSLKAINPWEGASDPYRDRAMHGGIRETRFRGWWLESTSYSRTRVEDVVEMAIAHPLYDSYWADRAPDLSKIEVPVYAVVDWGDQGIHTRGTIEGFKQVASRDKWLEVHGQYKWPYYYREESLRRQREFFEAYLRDDSPAFDRPRVSVEVRDQHLEGTVRDDADWPLPATRYERVYLDARGSSLVAEPPAEGVVSYDSDAGQATFDLRFERDTELTGNMALRLSVQSDEADDLDLFVGVEKLDRDGNKVGFPFQSLYADGPVALGWLRVSHRELDDERSTEAQPWHRHERELPVPRGERISVDVEILPSSTLFRAGETLRLVIQGSELYPYPGDSVVIVHEETRNSGPHILHTGGAHAPYLVLPVVPRP
jgi:predicted acyl esterase